MLEGAGEFSREVVELHNHSPDSRKEEVVAKHCRDRDQKPRYSGDQCGTNARRHGGQVGRAGGGYSGKCIHYTPDSAEKAEKRRSAHSCRKEDHLAFETQRIFSHRAFHRGLHDTHLRSGYLRSGLEACAKSFIDFETAKELEAELPAASAIHGKNRCALESRTLPKKMQWLAVGTEQFKEPVAQHPGATDDPELGDHNRPREDGADKQRAEHELSGQRRVLKGVEQPTGALGENWLGEKRCRNQSAIAVVYPVPPIKGQSSVKPFVFLLVSLFIPVARADENRYDVLSKTLTPFFAIFAKERKSDDRAFALKIRIEQASNLPEELRGASAEIALQAPDKFRLHGPLLGETFTIVRNGQDVWINPGSKARALLDAAVAGRELPKADKKFKLGEFRLPFPEKHLKLLTALFSVKDLGFDTVDGVECRALDVSLMPELASAIEAEGWVSRLWIRPDYTPMRLTLARKGWNIVIRFDNVEFAKELPESAWEPAPEEKSDVLMLSPKEYSRFLRAIGGR